MPVSPQEVDRLLDTAAYTFVLDIPPHFARDVAAGRTPAVQVNVDATAAMQAGIGAGYIQQILATQIARYATRSDEVPADPVTLVTHVAYNPNVTGVMVQRHHGHRQQRDDAGHHPRPARRWCASASTARWIIC